MDEVYRSQIEALASVIGWEAAYQVVSKETHKRLESTKHDLYSLDGGLARDAAEIVKKYPGCDIWFELIPDGIGITVHLPTAQYGQEQAEEIGKAIQAAERKHLKVKVGGATGSFTITKTTRELPDDDEADADEK